ncbi:MAG: hypothetical protein AAF081_07840 [Actinomycetota bacterium]
MNRLADLRGILAFGAIVFAIVWMWQWIEDRPIESATTVTTTTTSSTTTTSPPTTTTRVEDAINATCSRSAEFVAEAELIPDDAGPGPLARLALSYWSDLEVVAIESATIEIGAVIDYYQSYLDTAEPFGFDTVQIILEGDKERFQQLVTRPAPGLEASRTMVQFLCQIDVPDQPFISPRSFDDLEDRLLDPP